MKKDRPPPAKIIHTWEHVIAILTMKIPRSNASLTRLTAWLFAFISLTSLFYSLKFAFSPPPCLRPEPDTSLRLSATAPLPSHAASGMRGGEREEERTGLQHIAFGIGASSKLWNRRKEYIKLWWDSDRMKGAVWLDRPVDNATDQDVLPQLMISGNTSSFKYSNSKGHRSAIRISRIVSETLRLMRSKGEADNVRWLVMGDDDTVFVPDNLVRVLSNYDHNQMYYIGGSSESHLQNIYFSYNMAYGGGGFAVSRPLALALERIQDRCIRRYPRLYGSDDRMQACMAELGIPLSREQGFHQFDVYGNVFGLLAAHPVAPLVSLHHIDVVEPIFPNMGRTQALKRLMGPTKVDSAAILQQSICYDKTRSWTVSVSWGYAVQILRGVYLPRDLEVPLRTFLSWYKKSDQAGFPFNTRPIGRNACQKPSVYFVSNALYNPKENVTASEYVRHWASDSNCKWKMADPSRIHRVLVFKKPDPNMWAKAPRRNCCRVIPTKKKNTMEINVGACEEDEVVEL